MTRDTCIAMRCYQCMIMSPQRDLKLVGTISFSTNSHVSKPGNMIYIKKQFVIFNLLKKYLSFNNTYIKSWLKNIFSFYFLCNYKSLSCGCHISRSRTGIFTDLIVGTILARFHTIFTIKVLRYVHTDRIGEHWCAFFFSLWPRLTVPSRMVV